jgi:hypothetical protein
MSSGAGVTNCSVTVFSELMMKSPSGDRANMQMRFESGLWL